MAVHPTPSCAGPHTPSPPLPPCPSTGTPSSPGLRIMASLEPSPAFRLFGNLLLLSLLSTVAHAFLPPAPSSSSLSCTPFPAFNPQTRSQSLCLPPFPFTALCRSSSPSSTSPSSSSSSLEEIRKLRASVIKAELGSLGVSTAGIVDKEELVALLLHHRTHSPERREGTSEKRTEGQGGREAPPLYTARVKFRQKTPPSTLPGGGQAGPGPKSYVCVDLWIKNEKFEFLIDSGATPTIITERTRSRLNVRELAGGQRIEGVTATGGGAAPRVMLEEVSLLSPTERGRAGEGGGMVNMDALVMGNEGVLPPGVDGLLGVVWMRYFGLVDFDWASQSLTVYPYDVRDRTSGSGDLGLVLETPSPSLLARGVNMRQDPMSGIYFVNLFLTPPGASPPVPAIVDLGAGLSMVNWRAAKQAGVERESSSRVVRNAMSVWGIDGTTLPVDLCDFEALSLENGVTLNRKRIGVADLPAFALIGYGSKPVGVVGMDVLGGTDPNNRRIVFDFRRSMLYMM